jgi:uncharacterized membrane protein
MFSFRKSPQPLLPKADQQLIVEAIQEVELNCSAEIRVFVESNCINNDAMERGAAIFDELKMQETAERNAVLLYIALADRKYALLGDQGIHEKVGGNDYWQNVVAEMANYFKQNEIAAGLCYAIREVGEHLKKHFPSKGDADVNELPDEIVFGK